jgi:hypothetical protein
VDQRLAPRVSIMASSSAPRRDVRFGCFRLRGLKSWPAGSASYPPYSLFRAATNRAARDAAADRTVAHGLSTLVGQQLVLKGKFFVSSVYLWVVLGLDAFQVGKHLLPLSVAMFVFALLGQRIAARRSLRTVAQLERRAGANGRRDEALPSRIRASAATRALATRASLPSRSPKAASGVVAARDYDRVWCRSRRSSST